MAAFVGIDAGNMLKLIETGRTNKGWVYTQWRDTTKNMYLLGRVADIVTKGHNM